MKVNDFHDMAEVWERDILCRHADKCFTLLSSAAMEQLQTMKFRKFEI